MDVLDKNGLRRGEKDLQVYIMAEIPTNILEAPAFAERFDGFSIGSNDLTQLTLGIGRDSEKLAPLFDESEASVKILIRMLIESAHKAGRKVGICGEAPSNDTEFAAFLVEAGIDSISLQPDSVLQVIRRVAEMEQN
jgi:pyruvate,water dikinase